MEIASTHTNVIVPEVLRGGNYKRWSIFMRYYLLGQDLWDVVQSSQLPAGGNTSSEWMKKNALALHAIMISCGEKIFARIKEKDSAKDVWDALADMHKSPVVHQEIERQTGPGKLASSQYETLIKAISDGELSKVKKFFRENSNVIAAGISENGYTALHFAVYNEQEEIVEYLIESNLSLEELEIKDKFGSTALSIAARYGIGKSIAYLLVRKNRNLLTIPDNDGKIPVELACSTIQEGMTRALYHMTPLESLNVDRGFYILQKCITRKMFDIAFDLLHHFPELASHNCSLDSDPLILTLAQTPPPFFRGSNLSFWEFRIYDCISVMAYVIREDHKHRLVVQEIVDKIEDLYRSCKMMVQHCFQMIQEKKQERIFQRKNQERIQRKNEEWIQRKNQERNLQRMNQESIQRMNQEGKSFSNSCVFLFAVSQLNQVIVIITWLAVKITIEILQYLGKLIRGALRMLVSMISRFFGTHLYQLKLMDEYAREVIHLICHQPLSELDQNQFVQSKAVVATFQAIKNGIPDIVKGIIKADANNVLWCNKDPEDPSRNIFDCAIAHRQEEVAHFLYESQKQKNMLFAIDEDGNNALHLAAKLAPIYKSGYIYAAALQLQSELRWFKSIKEIVPVAYKGGKNKDNETPLEMFVREHKGLLEEAEEWAKKTAESSTVVGALIITIMFAVAFSVPGGNDQGTGFPVLLHKTRTPFMIFMVSDAISLFTASSSVLMFLRILTSHHSDEDYRKAFPLIIGLTSLFVSIATMTTAFCAALFMMLQGQGGLGLVIPITLFAGIPIVCYVWLQFPLLVKILGLTFSSNIFAKKGTFPTRETEDMVTTGMRNLRS